MARARSRLACLALSAVVASACAVRHKASDTATPAATAAPPREGSGDPALDLESYEAELRALGIATSTDDGGTVGGEVAGGAETTAAAADRDGDRCSRICALAEAICDIETKVCDLASAHPDDAHYADVCVRADRDCDVASAACRECG